MNYSVREYKECDESAVIALLNQSLSEKTDKLSYSNKIQSMKNIGTLNRLVAEMDSGKIIGYGICHPYFLDTNPQYKQIQIWIDKDHRFIEVSKNILLSLEKWCRQENIRRLHVITKQDNESSLFLEKFKFNITKSGIESTLNLDNWDPSKFNDVLNNIKKLGIRFTNLAAEGVTEENLMRRYKLEIQLFEDDPGSSGGKVPSFSQWKQMIYGTGIWNPEGIWMAVDRGREVAGVDLFCLRNGSVYNAGTMVDREYRGKSLGLALKVVALDWAKKKGMKMVRTNNESTNLPIININSKLGFKTVEKSSLFIKDISNNRFLENKGEVS